jgi:hypothetical protein
MQASSTKQPTTPQAFSHNGLGGPIGLEGAGVLVGLGLSGRQALVYLVLLRLGAAEVRAVADAAGVARQEVYRLLSELQQTGLVLKNLTIPTVYSAVAFPEAVKLLFEKHAGREISLMANYLTGKFSLSPSNAAVELTKPCFGVVSGGGRGKKYAAALQGAQGSVELVLGWVRFGQLCFLFDAELRAALKRGVRIRAAVEKSPCCCHLPKLVSELDRSMFELRTLQSLPPVALAIFDGVEIGRASCRERV